MAEKKLIEPFIFNEDHQVAQNTTLQKAMDFDVRTKSVEEKIYIILYKLDGDDLEQYLTDANSIIKEFRTNFKSISMTVTFFYFLFC